MAAAAALCIAAAGIAFLGTVYWKGENRSTAALSSEVPGNDKMCIRDRLGMDQSGVFITKEYDTGCALILVGEDSGQNEIVVVPGACLTFTSLEVDCVKDQICGNDCEYVLMQLETNLDAVTAIAECAAAGGKQVILNPAPAAVLPEQIWRWIDIVTPCLLYTSRCV